MNGLIEFLNVRDEFKLRVDQAQTGAERQALRLERDRMISEFHNGGLFLEADFMKEITI